MHLKKPRPGAAIVTSNRPCLFTRVLESMVQKLMWDFPQVTIRLSSMGWNTAASTESLEHCRDGKHEGKRLVSLRIVEQTQIRTKDLFGYLDLSQLLLLLPVPNGQDVIVGIVHSTQEGAAVLTGREPVRSNYLWAGSRLEISRRVVFLPTWRKPRMWPLCRTLPSR